MQIVTSSAQPRSGTARRFVLRAARGIVLLASLAAGCQDIDRDPPQFPDGGAPRNDASSASPDGGDASASSDASAGDAARDSSSGDMDGGDAGTQDGGADDASADGSADDAAADATVLPACTTPAAGPDGCFACTVQGWLEGVREADACSYRGVPYAKPPLGPLRFAPPEAAEGWTGVRLANAFGAACVQGLAGFDLSGTETKSEDCLFVNVWSPSAAPATPLPVMVFIHGGGYAAGATNTFSGIALSSKGPVVVVSMNYRLGALGFFAHPDLDMTRADRPSGADGIRDQQLALRWVKDNIAAFHGDPNNVTLFGESAGASSICVHLVSPGSRQLANRFILESGVCTRGVANAIEVAGRANVYAKTQRLADALCPDAGDEIACLRGLPAADVMSWTPTGDGGVATTIDWAPMVENDGGVLPDYPTALIDRGEFNRGSVIVGTNANEYGVFQPPPLSADDYRTRVEAQFGERAADVLGQYEALASSDPYRAYVTLMTDITFRCPTREFAQLLADHDSNVYLYSFEQGTAVHGDELAYVFGEGRYTLAVGTPVPALVDRMQRYWTSFALDGDPNSTDLPDWPAYRSSNDRHLRLVDPPEASNALARDACNFWDSYLDSL
jgi:para-nitrobenzyl esterase